MLYLVAWLIVRQLVIVTAFIDKYGQSIGLYRDDGLAAFNKTPKEIEKIKKELCKIFHENDLKIMIEAIKSIVNFPDVTLDLQSGKHYPYTKEGNIPLYCLLYTSPSPRDLSTSRMPSSA